MKVSRIASALGLAVAATFAASAGAQQITLMTGPQGGVWVPLGGQLKSMWEKAIPGMSVTAIPGAGIANVRGVDEGKAQSGFGNSSTTVDGLAGEAPYPKKVTKVCQVANLYPQYFQIVALASSGVNTVGLQRWASRNGAIWGIRRSTTPAARSWPMPSMISSVAPRQYTSGGNPPPAHWVHNCFG